MADETDSVDLDLAEALGAAEGASPEQLTLYIPDRDREGNELGNQRAWVLEASRLLARIGGGVTIMPPMEGGWLDPATDKIVWERPVLVYTFIKTDKFVALLPELRAFLHRLGRETKQGEVLVNFNGIAFRITEFREAP